MIYLAYFFSFLFGLNIGSFLNCLIWRLHKNETVLGRSYCPECKHQLAWYDNIPLFSFLFLSGKCRYCHKKISWQYPLVEFVTAVLFFLAFYLQIRDFYNVDLVSILTLLRNWFLISVMVVVFVYDLRWYLILDIITLPSAVVILIFNFVISYLKYGSLPGELWLNMLISVIIGAGFFLLQFVVSQGRWIGGGDIRLGLVMGLALGWPSIVLAIFLSYILGSIIGLGLIAAGKKEWGSQIPFGVFLTTGTLITLFYGETIISWYLKYI